MHESVSLLAAAVVGFHSGRSGPHNVGIAAVGVLVGETVAPFVRRLRIVGAWSTWELCQEHSSRAVIHLPKRRTRVCDGCVPIRAGNESTWTLEVQDGGSSFRRNLAVPKLVPSPRLGGWCRHGGRDGRGAPPHVDAAAAEASRRQFDNDAFAITEGRSAMGPGTRACLGGNRRRRHACLCTPEERRVDS